MPYQFANINGVRMHYDVQGQGDPLVLIHAGIANLDMWEAQLPDFTQHYQVIRYDVRGFGHTPDPAGKYTDYDDLKTMLVHLGISKAHVLGISNGGRIAMELALSYPAMVDKLVMVAPGLPGFKINDPFDDEISPVLDAALEAGDNAKAAELEAHIWVDGPGRQPEDVDPAFRKKALALIRHTIDLGIGEGEGDFARPLAATRLNEIKSPALLVIGDEDLLGLHQIADKLQQDIPNLKRVDMPGTAHLPTMEKPEAFNRIVLDFLQE